MDVNDYCVYKHTSPSGKVYIGIAKDVKHRWRGGGNGYKGSTRIWCAIQKYGWDNFKHEILAQNLTKEEACKKEICLIEEYRSTDPRYGYNLTSGGEHFTFSQESIEKLRLSQTGPPVSKEVREKLSRAQSVPLICLETGKKYKNSRDAAADMGLCYTSILKVAKGKQSTCGGFHFARVEDYNQEKIPVFVPSPQIFTKVLCKTTGEIFENVSDASRKTGISRRAISYACNGIHSTCGGLTWKFIEEVNNNE